jgi:hypothetical protein
LAGVDLTRINGPAVTLVLMGLKRRRYRAFDIGSQGSEQPAYEGHPGRAEARVPNDYADDHRRQRRHHSHHHMEHWAKDKGSAGKNWHRQEPEQEIKVAASVARVLVPDQEGRDYIGAIQNDGNSGNKQLAVSPLGLGAAAFLSHYRVSFS